MRVSKLDSSDINRGKQSETIPPLNVTRSTVSLFSTDDPVDKLPLVLVPLVSSAGVRFPKTSEMHRSHICGDNVLKSLADRNSLSQKLRCIPGLGTALPTKEVQSQLNEAGAVFFSLREKMNSDSGRNPASQKSPPFPASLNSLFDYLMSALRVSSVKGAVFNIKIGEGSPIKKIREARNLAQSLKGIFKRRQIKTSLFLTDSSQPIGQALGNSLEIKEAVEILKGSGPLDLLKLALEFGSDMLICVDKTLSKSEAKEILKRKILNGDGLKKFREIIDAQKGDTRVIDNASLLPSSEERIKIRSSQAGFIQKIDTKKLYSVYLTCISQERSPADSGKCGIGFVLQKKSGDWVKKGESLIEVHSSSKTSRSWTEDEFHEIFTISETPPLFQPLIIERICD